jgi:putative transcriptional regulator
MKKDKMLKELGARVAKLRESKGMSKYALAKKMGKPYQSILRIETGRINPTYIYIQEIAKALDMELIELLKGL